MPIIEREKQAVEDLLIGEAANLPALIQLAKSVTQNVCEIESAQDALEYVCTHYDDPSSLLNKRLITREILFKYLHRKKVPVQTNFTKATLIQKVLDFWAREAIENGGSCDDTTPPPLIDTNSLIDAGSPQHMLLQQQQPHQHQQQPLQHQPPPQQHQHHSQPPPLSQPLSPHNHQQQQHLQQQQQHQQHQHQQHQHQQHLQQHQHHQALQHHPLPPPPPPLHHHIHQQQLQHDWLATEQQAPSQFDMAEYPIHLLARQFSGWFFENYNKGCLRLEDFWSDAHLQLRIMTNDGTNDNEAWNAEEVIAALVSTKSQFNVYYNPNLTHSGVQGRMDVHGLVLVLACGTLHNQQSCVGVFECTFGVLRDPYAENNWKVKTIQCLLRSNQDAALCLPNLYESVTLHEVMALPVPTGNEFS